MEKFNFEKAVKELLAGKKIGGKDGILAPQKPQLNRRLWAKIERFVRIQARKYKDIRVITGVLGV